MAFQNSFQSQREPSGNSEFLNRLEGVIRTCRIEPAIVSQQGRQQELIRSDQDQDNSLHAYAFLNPAAWTMEIY